ncbi:hypothetical protein [Methanoculleus receptaculi]|uniref:Uncharacterized protein n=1 Tax=Methanoculleus receptaculi TaxID=394967 RepID=A0AAX4FTN4_9EURY|nr:hypothetical protein [Methanoculleus receptaculi]WOX57293.1 hypothetical protein R6Y96_08285 [Methanoculleus receptaculi]
MSTSTTSIRERSRPVCSYVPVYTTGTPYQTFRVEKDGYTTYYGEVTSVPGKGEVFGLYAGTKLEPFPQSRSYCRQPHRSAKGDSTPHRCDSRRSRTGSSPIPFRGIADRSPPAR